MTQREIARLCCKIIAIYALIRMIESVRGLTIIFYMWPLLYDSWEFGLPLSSYAAVLFGVMPTVFLAAFSIFFWRKSGIIAAWITGHDLQDDPDEPDPIPMKVGAQELQAVAFATIGLWAAVSSISSLINLGAELIISSLASTEISVEEDSLFQLLSEFASPVALLLLGFWLIFSARGIVRLLYKLRKAGHDESAKSS